MIIVGKWVFTIFNEENDFRIAKYQDVSRGYSQEFFVAKGFSIPVAPGFVVSFEGEWERSNGRKTFVVSAFESEPPNTKEDMFQYLQSLRCGIGPKSFELLYREFGERLWQVIEYTPEKLKKVRGIKKLDTDKLINSYKETTKIRDLMRLFRKIGIPNMSKLNKLTNVYGADAASRIRDNPYLIVSCGFSFVEADALADDLGFDKSRPERATAGLLRLLYEKESEGHCYMPIKHLSDLAIKQLTTNELHYDEMMIRASVQYLEREGLVVNDEGSIYRKARYAQETNISSNIIRIQSGICRTHKNLDLFISQYEKQEHITLADQQRLAIKRSFESTFHIITGGPGTGKTTILKGVLFCHEKIMQERKIHAKPILMAPTGRAARRLAEATKHPAYTIHKALGIRGEDTTDFSGGTLEASMVVVDESSMMDAEIASLLFAAIQTGTQLILVGDTDQLPSVGCGNVLREVIGSHCVEVTKLNVIFRQGDKSSIIANSKKIRDGIVNLTWDKNFKFFAANSTRSVYDYACSMYVRCVKGYGIDNVALLCPYRDKGSINAKEFNRILQNYFNPHDDNKPELKIGSQVFRLRDKVMMTVNTDFVSNGDIGYIVGIDRTTNEDGKSEVITTVNFGHDIGEVQLSKKDMVNVTLAYCCSIHKSQGAEYNTVIIAMSSEHKIMLRRNLIYTAVTRATEHVAIVGDMAALDTAIKTDVVDQRNTKLGSRLKKQKGVKACLREITSTPIIKKILPMLTLRRVSRLAE